MSGPTFEVSVRELAEGGPVAPLWRACPRHWAAEQHAVLFVHGYNNSLSDA